MSVDIADTGPEEPMSVDEMQYFQVRGELGLRQVVKVVENKTARLKIAECEFANHERMDQNPF